MSDLLNKFMDFAYDKCREIQSNDELKPPTLDALLAEFNELPPQPNSTTNMRNLQKYDFYSVRTYTEIKQAVKTESNVHHLYVREGQVCKSAISKDDNEKVKQFITFSVKYILEYRHRGSELPPLTEISAAWDRVSLPSAKSFFKTLHILG